MTFHVMVGRSLGYEVKTLLLVQIPGDADVLVPEPYIEWKG